jgi:predicted secreted protein
MAVTSRLVAWALALLLCGALLGTGAARADDKKEGEKVALPLPTGGVLLTQNDGGANVTIRHGQVVVVSLEFKAGTGSGWKVKQDCKTHLTLKEHVVLRAGKGPPIGSPRYSVYVYQAASIGKCDLAYQAIVPRGALGKTVTYHLTVLPRVAKEGAKPKE